MRRKRHVSGRHPSGGRKRLSTRSMQTCFVELYKLPAEAFTMVQSKNWIIDDPGCCSRPEKTKNNAMV